MNRQPPTNVTYDPKQVAAFCDRWKVRELSLFGSVLTDSFGPSSDVDVLVVFEPDAPWSYWDWTAMCEELQRIFGRPIDLVEKKSLVNPYRRSHILNHREVIYGDAA